MPSSMECKSPNEIYKKIPVSLSNLVMECVKERPADRPANMSEIIARPRCDDSRNFRTRTQANATADQTTVSQGAEATHRPLSTGQCHLFTRSGRVIVVGDLHGHRRHLKKLSTMQILKTILKHTSFFKRSFTAGRRTNMGVVCHIGCCWMPYAINCFIPDSAYASGQS